ncbi:MAG: hypothetical protein CTY16_14770 [Methylobacter sp.]|nr:MAG: hypothetical protein CTY16_14770 [Methylobacter sp.]
MPRTNSNERQPAKLDQILRFLPWFEAHSQDMKPTWLGLEGPPSLSVMAVYPKEVEDFFQLASEPFWCDYRYDVRAAEVMVFSDAAIGEATIDQIKTILTYCVRCEWFGEGHWQGMVRKGRILAILLRISELRGNLDEGGRLMEYCCRSPLSKPTPLRSKFGTAGCKHGSGFRSVCRLQPNIRGNRKP